MSPRSRMVGPGRAPSSVATTDDVDSPVRTRERQPVEGGQHLVLREREVEADLGALVEPPAQAHRVGEQIAGLEQQGVIGHAEMLGRGRDGAG